MVLNLNANVPYLNTPSTASEGDAAADATNGPDEQSLTPSAYGSDALSDAAALSSVMGLNNNGQVAFGTQTYGSAPVGNVATGNVAGFGRVATPPSSYANADGKDLQSIMGMMGGYGEASGSDQGGLSAVGQSLVYAAEQGNLPNLGAYSTASYSPAGQVALPSTGAGQNSGTAGYLNTLNNYITSTVSVTTASSTAAQAALDSAASSAAAAAPNGNSLISDTKIDTANGLDSTSSVVSTINDALSATDGAGKKNKCDNWTKGENQSIKALENMGLSSKEAKRITTVLSANRQQGLTGAAQTNVLNLIGVLDKLQQSGEGKSDAAKSAKSLLGTIGDEAYGQGETTNQFIADDNTAASYVTQYGLNPSLTSFTEPQVTSSGNSSVPWPTT